MKQTPRTNTDIAAEICLYGTAKTGAGWLAREAAGRMFGDGEPVASRSFTAAVWLAVDELRAAGVRRGAVRIFDPSGDRMSVVLLEHHVPAFGDLQWQAAPQYTISLDVLNNVFDSTEWREK